MYFFIPQNHNVTLILCLISDLFLIHNKYTQLWEGLNMVLSEFDIIILSDNIEG